MGPYPKYGRIGSADRALVYDGVSLRCRRPAGIDPLRGEVSTFRDHNIAALPPFHPASNTAEG